MILGLQKHTVSTFILATGLLSNCCLYTVFFCLLSDNMFYVFVGRKTGLYLWQLVKIPIYDIIITFMLLSENTAFTNKHTPNQRVDILLPLYCRTEGLEILLGCLVRSLKSVNPKPITYVMDHVEVPLRTSQLVVFWFTFTHLCLMHYGIREGSKKQNCRANHFNILVFKVLLRSCKICSVTQVWFKSKIWVTISGAL